ncbi:MAG: PilW family protein [Acidobacteriota bacterium]
MLCNCKTTNKEKGFTLIEVTVSLIILVVVMALSMTLLFSMQGFARRQRQFAEPRQNARRAVDYISGLIRAATDMNFKANNPNAIVVWYRIGNNPTQATYNNVQNAQFAEIGTDIITIGSATSGTGRIQIADWNPPASSIPNASSLDLIWDEGCPNQDTSLQLLKEATGGCQPCANGGGCCSSVLTVYSDVDGSWTYMEITNYPNANQMCNADKKVHLVANPGLSHDINPPGDRNVSKPCYIGGGGLTYNAFRVKRTDPNDPLTTQLQQKRGLFDPNNPDDGFFGILDNVEDLQFAYIYNDGTVWNDSVNLLPTNQNVPVQDMTPVDPRDVTNLVGIRISVVARANTPVSFTERAKFFRPASEDRAEDANRDRFYHHRMTTTVMLRNRNLGG